MTELSRDARSLVARARVHEGPSPDDRARLRARLEPAWEARGQASELAPAAPTSPLARVFRRPPIVKMLLLLIAASWTPSPPSDASHAAPEAIQALDASPRDASVESGAAPIAAEPAVDRAASSASERGTAADSAGPESASSAPLSAASPRPGHVRASGQPARRNARSENRARESVAGRDREDASGPTAAAAAAKPAALPGSISATDSKPRDPAPVQATESVGVRSAQVAEKAPRSRAPVQSGTEFKPQPIDDELAWLGAAQEALQNHKPSLALRLVEEHSFRFPDGALTQERLVVHTLALCALERFTAARRMLEVLAERAPDAPILARVRSHCGF